jgi:hypothetical protein
VIALYGMTISIFFIFSRSLKNNALINEDYENNKTDLSLNVLKAFHFAFFRFSINNMLTKEEEEHKEEIIQVTEEVLEAKGIKCDARLSYMSVTLRSPEISYYISRIK